MICEDCGIEMQIGFYPFCHGDPNKHVRQAASVNGDEIPGGLVIENLGHQPLTFYSKKAIVDVADQRGLRLTDKWAGPSDQHLTNWAAGIDAQTLDNARILLTRAGQSRTPSDPAALQTVRTSIRSVTSLEGL